MEESMTERISRYIDGDLGPDEIETLEARLESDPELRRELEGLTRVRTALRSFAIAKLDALVDPLLRGRPGGAASRPWVRWLATAAAVVLGVTVILEVERRSPPQSVANWQEIAQEKAAETREPFSLAPLPTSTVPEKDRPLGAVDHLVAETAPEIAPSTDADPAIGGWETFGNAGAGRGCVDSAGSSGPAIEVLGPLESAEEELRQGTRSAALSGKAARGDASSEPAYPDRVAAGALTETGKRVRSERSTAQAAAPEAQLFVFMEAKTAWRSFVPSSPCEAGRYSIRIRVQDGIVREVWPVANPPAPSRQVRASQLILGLEIGGVPDGQYSAEVVVEPRPPTTP